MILFTLQEEPLRLEHANQEASKNSRRTFWPNHSAGASDNRELEQYRHFLDRSNG